MLILLSVRVSDFLRSEFGSSHKHNICTIPNQLSRMPNRIHSDAKKPQ